MKGVHVLGDATLSAPAMPKSGSMANNHAKIAAAAIVELLNGRAPQPVKIINTCYSFVSQKEGDPRLVGARVGRRTGHAHAGEGLGRRVRRAQRSRRRPTPGTGPAPSGPILAGVATFPVEPKPPAPRALAANSSTTSNSTCTTGTTTSCAMRSSGWMVNARLAAVPQRDHQRPLVVGVDQADQVAEHDAVLRAEARARQDHRGVARIADVDGDAGGDQLAFAGIAERALVSMHARRSSPAAPGAGVVRQHAADPLVEDLDLAASSFARGSLAATCSTSLRASSSFGPRPSGCSPSAS